MSLRVQLGGGMIVSHTSLQTPTSIFLEGFIKYPNFWFKHVFWCLKNMTSFENYTYNTIPFDQAFPGRLVQLIKPEFFIFRPLECHMKGFGSLLGSLRAELSSLNSMILKRPGFNDSSVHYHKSCSMKSTHSTTPTQVSFSFVFWELSHLSIDPLSHWRHCVDHVLHLLNCSYLSIFWSVFGISWSHHYMKQAIC